MIYLLSHKTFLQPCGSSSMPVVLDIPSTIPVPGQLLQLICVDASRHPPLLYLAHDSPSGCRVYTAELSWSYVVTNHASLSSSAPDSVNSSALTSASMGFVSHSGGAGMGSLPAPRR